MMLRAHVRLESWMNPRAPDPPAAWTRPILSTASAARDGVERNRTQRAGPERPALTVRSKIPSEARKADSGTIGKRSLRSPVTFDQS